jgi:hypothetical protein
LICTKTILSGTLPPLVLHNPILIVGATVKVAFQAAPEEANAYVGKDISNIFSVKVHTLITTTTIVQTYPVLINTNQPATLTLISPNGGEVLHVGETINITWKTTNMLKSVPVSIHLLVNGSNRFIDAIIYNTGSYQWTVPSELVGQSIIGTNVKVELEANGGGQGIVLSSVSASGFTILPN